MNKKPLPHKSRAAVAWDSWIAGNRGQECAAGVTSGNFLRNRLWYAFVAGWDAAIIFRRNKARAKTGRVHPSVEGEIVVEATIEEDPQGNKLVVVDLPYDFGEEGDDTCLVVVQPMREKGL